jgi:hypothetical protein
VECILTGWIFCFSCLNTKQLELSHQLALLRFAHVTSFCNIHVGCLCKIRLYQSDFLGLPQKPRLCIRYKQNCISKINWHWWRETNSNWNLTSKSYWYGLLINFDSIQSLYISLGDLRSYKKLPQDGAIKYPHCAPLEASRPHQTKSLRSVLGPVVQRNFVTVLALNCLGVKSTGLSWRV